MGIACIIGFLRMPFDLWACPATSLQASFGCHVGMPRHLYRILSDASSILSGFPACPPCGRAYRVTVWQTSCRMSYSRFPCCGVRWMRHGCHIPDTFAVAYDGCGADVMLPILFSAIRRIMLPKTKTAGAEHSPFLCFGLSWIISR